MKDKAFNDPSSADLVKLASASNGDAFEALMTRATPLATRLVKRMVRDDSTARELVHQATVVAYTSLERLQEPEKFTPWLCGIALNLARGYLRRMRPDELSLESLAGGVTIEAVAGSISRNDPVSAAEEKEIEAVLKKAIGALPPGSREVAWMYYGEELKTSEIAERLGISDGATRVRLSRARQQLMRHVAASEVIDLPSRRTQSKELTMIEIEVADVVEQDVAETAEAGSRTASVVGLHDASRRKVLPIWMGVREGAAIALALSNVTPPRPLTYSFVANLIQTAGADMAEARITALQGDTFIASVVLNGGGGESREVDARPSDAINLALATGRPIFVSEDVMERAGLDVEEGMRVRRGDGARMLADRLSWWLKPSQAAGDTDPERIEEARARFKEAIFAVIV